MINYLPYIFGLTSLILGLYTFFLSFRIYNPRHKTEGQRERHEKLLEKYGTLMKACSIALILSGSYDLITRSPDRYSIGNRNSEWTSEDRAILVKNCIRDSGPTAINYPQITNEYCECSMDKIINRMTKEQYERTLSKPQEEQIKEVLPIFQDCVDELKLRIDSTDRRQSNSKQ
jgi:hypothetical protein